MVEIRWFITPLARPGVIAFPAGPDKHGNQCCAVMQFRVRTDVPRYGVLQPHPPLPGDGWSDWTDVPAVRDTSEVPRVVIAKPGL